MEDSSREDTAQLGRKVERDLGDGKKDSSPSFNFTTISRSGFTGGSLPLMGIVRINRKRIGLAGDIARRFEFNESSTGRRTYDLAIRVDDVNQAISIGRPMENEYPFKFGTPTGNDAGYASTSLPVDMQKNHSLPSGDYVEVTHNVFVLAK